MRTTESRFFLETRSLLSWTSYLSTVRPRKVPIPVFDLQQTAGFSLSRERAKRSIAWLLLQNPLPISCLSRTTAVSPCFPFVTKTSAFLNPRCGVEGKTEWWCVIGKGQELWGFWLGYINAFVGLYFPIGLCEVFLIGKAWKELL